MFKSLIANNDPHDKAGWWDGDFHVWRVDRDGQANLLKSLVHCETRAQTVADTLKEAHMPHVTQLLKPDLFLEHAGVKVFHAYTRTMITQSCPTVTLFS